MKGISIKYAYLALFHCLHFYKADANMDSTKINKPNISWEAFGDFFWAYDNTKPVEERRQTFLYNHNRQAKVDLNLAYFKLNLTHTNYRANISVQTGTYVRDNYASDHSFWRNFAEANAGLALNKKKNLWLDAGIFTSHIGFESAISSENKNLSRSLLAENSPYYMAGAKLSFEPNNSWKICAALLNGWQRINPIEGNSLPAFGTQITYSQNPNLLYNWSTFIGSTAPDSSRRMRYFQNFYSQYQINNQLSVLVGLDIGLQQTSPKRARYDLWFSPIAIAQYQWNNRFKTAARIERYADINNVIIAPINQQGFDCNGYSINLDYAPNPTFLFRVETRYLRSANPIFLKEGTWQYSSLSTLVSMVFKLGKKKI